MGKQTLVHPVPLSVLRGALEFCQWKFATLKQVKDRIHAKEVVYKVTSLKPPKDAPRMDPQGVQHTLQNCYTSQIYVERVLMDSAGKIDAWIVVRNPGLLDHQDGTNAAMESTPF
jgi:hypothetical protein